MSADGPMAAEVRATTPPSLQSQRVATPPRMPSPLAYPPPAWLSPPPAPGRTLPPRSVCPPPTPPPLTPPNPPTSTRPGHHQLGLGSLRHVVAATATGDVTWLVYLSAAASLAWTPATLTPAPTSPPCHLQRRSDEDLAVRAFPDLVSAGAPASAGVPDRQRNLSEENEVRTRLGGTPGADSEPHPPRRPPAALAHLLRSPPPASGVPWRDAPPPRFDRQAAYR